MSQKYIIWMHGLGASKSDMEGLSKALPIRNVRCQHIALQAPMRPVTINQGYVMPAWYDIFSLNRGAMEDEKGIKASSTIINQEINALLDKGIKAKDIWLAGFSQGAAMALYTAFQQKESLGGVIALSGYLPLADSFHLNQIEKHLDVPIFLAHGKQDEVVPLAFALASKQKLEALTFSNISASLYGMGHEVCEAELGDIARFVEKNGPSS